MKVAKNACGFNLPEVQKVLHTCEIIFTTNRYALPILESMFNARIFVMLQDMDEAMIRKLLEVVDLLPAGEPLEVVSTLSLFNKSRQEPDEKQQALAFEFHQAKVALTNYYINQGERI